MFGEFVLGPRRRLKKRDDDLFIIFCFGGVFLLRNSYINRG